MAKHLVIDEDVHRALLKQKAVTGLNVQDIGNAALRSLLGQPPVPERIGRRLVETGKLTKTEFEAVWRGVLNEISAQVPSTEKLVRSTRRGTLTTGSWEFKELLLDAKDGFQVVRVWAKDARARPVPAHRHASTEILIVLAGKISLTIDNELRVIDAPGCQQIPKGTSHAVAPLARDTTLLVVFSPPDDALHT